MNELEPLELKISHFLRIGVIVSAVLMFAGWITELNWSGDPFYNFQTYDQISFVSLVKFHLKRQDWGVLTSYLGLIALISLPLIRVFLTAILFLKQKEYVLAGIASIVLIGLVGSMALGFQI